MILRPIIVHIYMKLKHYVGTIIVLICNMRVTDIFETIYSLLINCTTSIKWKVVYYIIFQFTNNGIQCLLENILANRIKNSIHFVFGLLLFIVFYKNMVGISCCSKSSFKNNISKRFSISSNYDNVLNKVQNEFQHRSVTKRAVQQGSRYGVAGPK